MEPRIVAIIAGVTMLLLGGIVVVVTRCYRRVEHGRALIIRTMNDTRVTFSGGVVLPVLHHAEVMDISVKMIEIDRRGTKGVICRDSIRADIQATFFVRVNQTQEDVLQVARLIGCARASDSHTIEELFAAKFSEALGAMARQLDFEQLHTQRDDFKDEVIRAIGRDLNGFVLDDVAIDYLEQTPIEHLDPNNVLDARGIRKILELTAQAREQLEELEALENRLRQEEHADT
jgi:uncharacterized membrane protein YqiK